MFALIIPNGDEPFSAPSCHQKNVQTTARFILEHVLAAVPHRHYVRAIPKLLRPYFQRHRPLLKRFVTAGVCTYEPCDDVDPTPDYENVLTD